MWMLKCFFERGKKNSASFYGSGIFLFIGLVISSASLPFMLSVAEVQRQGSSFLWAGLACGVSRK
jgi:hypothetical protein